MKLIVLLATIATAHAGLRGLQATLDLDEDEMKVYVNNLGEMTDEDYAEYMKNYMGMAPDEDEFVSAESIEIEEKLSSLGVEEEEEGEEEEPMDEIQKLEASYTPNLTDEEYAEYMKRLSGGNVSEHSMGFDTASKNYETMMIGKREAEMPHSSGVVGGVLDLMENGPRD